MNMLITMVVMLVELYIKDFPHSLDTKSNNNIFAFHMHEFTHESNNKKQVECPLALPSSSDGIIATKNMLNI